MTFGHCDEADGPKSIKAGRSPTSRPLERQPNSLRRRHPNPVLEQLRTVPAWQAMIPAQDSMGEATWKAMRVDRLTEVPPAVPPSERRATVRQPEALPPLPESFPVQKVLPYRGRVSQTKEQKARLPTVAR